MLNLFSYELIRRLTSLRSFMSLFGCPVRFLITQIKTGPCEIRFLWEDMGVFYGHG